MTITPSPLSKPYARRAPGHSRRLGSISYDVRGAAAERAAALEASGVPVLRLNIGDPAAFRFEAREEILEAVAEGLATATTYSESQGLPAAREAVADTYRESGLAGVTADDVFLGNGVSEVIPLALQALLDDGDEVLVPSPCYPLWPGAVRLCGGVPVHYACAEDAGWAPDLDDLARAVTERTRAVVVINPNNPTGAVYSPAVLAEVVEIARESSLVVLADEIYDRIVHAPATHTRVAAGAPELLCVTFGGLSKSHGVPGLRAGWLALSGPREHVRSYADGLKLVASLRLCPNVAGQLAVGAAVRLDSLAEDVDTRIRLRDQRDRACALLNALPGVSCIQPDGAFYAFPRIVPPGGPIRDDRAFALDLLLEEHLLIVPGSAFDWPRPDHVRIVTLPAPQELEEAAARLGRFVARYRG